MNKKTDGYYRLPADPERQDFYDWLSANRSFYANFRNWLKESSYSHSARNVYSVAARYAIGYLKKPYWQIDPEQDFPLVEAYLQRCPLAPSTVESYHKGLLKLGDYLRIRLNKPAPERAFNWPYYLEGLPEWFEQALRAYLAHCRRQWLPERYYETGKDLLGCLTGSLRWMAAHFSLNSAIDITPTAWLAYLDLRLEMGRLPTTVNGELAVLQHFLRFLENQGEPICERILRVDYLKEGPKLPKDASPPNCARCTPRLKKTRPDASLCPPLRRNGPRLVPAHAALRAADRGGAADEAGRGGL